MREQKTPELARALAYRAVFDARGLALEGRGKNQPLRQHLG